MGGCEARLYPPPHLDRKPGLFIWSRYRVKGSRCWRALNSSDVATSIERPRRWRVLNAGGLRTAIGQNHENSARLGRLLCSTPGTDAALFLEEICKYREINGFPTGSARTAACEHTHTHFAFLFARSKIQISENISLSLITTSINAPQKSFPFLELPIESLGDQYVHSFTKRVPTARCGPRSWGRSKTFTSSFPLRGKMAACCFENSLITTESLFLGSTGWSQFPLNHSGSERHNHRETRNGQVSSGRPPDAPASLLTLAQAQAQVSARSWADRPARGTPRRRTAPGLRTGRLRGNSRLDFRALEPLQLRSEQT